MATWRQPGEPYVITVAGIEITCKPLLRGHAMNMAELASTGMNTAADMEAFYANVVKQVTQIKKIDTDHTILGDKLIKEGLDFQTHEFMLELFIQMIGAAGLTDEQAKNLKSLSDTSPAEPPTGDAPTAAKDAAGTKV